MHLIGISSFTSENRIALNAAYISAFTRPSCAALIIPPFPVLNREFLTLDKFKADFRAHIDKIVERLDALVLSGGKDINPVAFGQTNYSSTGCDIVRDYTELALLDAFIQAGKPILGVCKGHQLGAMYFGLSNFQQDLVNTHELHQQIGHEMARSEPCHKIWPRGNLKTYLSSKLGYDVKEASINSMHSQGLTLTANGKFPDKKILKPFETVPGADDGFSGWYHRTVAAYEAKHSIKILATTPIVIEAFEHPEARFLGLQAHPEEAGPQGLLIQYWLDSFVL